MDTGLAGKAVLITGSSRGIGRATARAFAAEGARLCVHYNTNRAAAEETLVSLQGSGHMVAGGNLRDPSSAPKIVDAVIQTMGRIDVLVNSAGVYELHSIPYGSSDKSLTYEQWQEAWHRSIDLNLTGTSNITFCAVQQMLKQGGGRIVNVSSRGAFRGEPEAPAYSASKAGLNSLTQSLAKALAPQKIYLFAVAPGFVETDMSAEVLAGPLGDKFRRESPMGRVATPEEVARTILFLVSEGSQSI